MIVYTNGTCKENPNFSPIKTVEIVVIIIIILIIIIIIIIYYYQKIFPGDYAVILFTYLKR